MKDEGVQNLIIRLGEDAQIMRGASGFPTIAAEIAEAAQALSTLLQEREALRKALEPFAEAYDVAPEYLRDSPEHCCIWDTEASNKITIGDLRAARSALSPENGDEK
jgi:hypothetical protein